MKPANALLTRHAPGTVLQIADRVLSAAIATAAARPAVGQACLIPEPQVVAILPPRRVRGVAGEGRVGRLFHSGSFDCRPAPEQKSHAISLCILCVHRSRRDTAGVTRAVGAAIGADDQGQ